MRELIMELFDPVIVRGFICYAGLLVGSICFFREFRKP